MTKTNVADIIRVGDSILVTKDEPDFLGEKKFQLKKDSLL
jgi:hypothetical protein